MWTPQEQIEARDRDAKEFARRLEPYLTTPEARFAFEYYAHAVRERTEAQVVLRLLRHTGFAE